MRIIELNAKKARAFLLKEECYTNIDLPQYFNFQNIIDKVEREIGKKKLYEIRKSTPRNLFDVNYHLLSNKDGKYAWRPLQLIHPAIYVSLVYIITEEENWKVIRKRFKDFYSNEKIECHSLPMVSKEKGKEKKSAQIINWWKMIEQRSITFSLQFKYVIHTDISDCYSSIYTHSIPWAIHGKEDAKKRENRDKHSLVGNEIDNHLQDMSYGQTNGIPQGSILMDFIAEIVLGYVDLLLSEKLIKLKINDYKILRYRDDFRIFTNNSFEAEQITKELSKILSDLGLKLNADKTQSSNDIIKSSIKSDKRYWINNGRVAENKQKWLVQIYLLSEEYPNSGTVDKQMRRFLKVLEKSPRKDNNLEALVSLVTEIAIRNPRVVPQAIAILSIFISRIDDKDNQNELIENIRNKFTQVPNSSLFMVWFQRLDLNIKKNEKYDESLCKKVFDSTEQIWNSDWLHEKLKKIISNTSIVDDSVSGKKNIRLSKREIKSIVINQNYF